MNKKDKNKTFVFTQKALEKLEYSGNGKSPQKYFDAKTDGLCLFVYPPDSDGNTAKVFYRVLKKVMFNKKKNISERNSIYKKVSRFSTAPFNLNFGKEKLARLLKESGTAAAAKNGSKKTFGTLANEFLKGGLDGFRLSDKGGEKYEYKDSTKHSYKKNINTYILLKPYGKTEKQKARNKKVRERLTRIIYHDGRISELPIKETPVDDITNWDIEVILARLKETKTTANSVIKLISCVFQWAINNKKYKKSNPCNNVGKWPERKIKAKLSRDDRTKVLNEVNSKAFDYEPWFLTFVGLTLYLGKRITELLGIRWKEPLNDREKKSCTGYLVGDYSKTKKLFLIDTKNRKDERVHLDNKSVALLQRLEKIRFNESKSWSLKSPYVFPQLHNPTKHVTESSFRKRLEQLNRKLNLLVHLKDDATGAEIDKLGFTLKYSRKTSISWFADKYGTRVASRKANHASEATTKKHYIVPEDEELEIENVFDEPTTDKDKIVRGVIVNTKK